MSQIVPASDFFKVTEHLDEQQIINVEAIKEILCYKDSRSGKYELSFRGIKQLVLDMAAKGFPLEVEDVNIQLLGEGKEKTWYVSANVRNQNTRLATHGEAEQPFYENDSKQPPTFKEPLTQDPFARRKAVSKAIRNAQKQQLPEAMIHHMVNSATSSGKVKVVENKPKPANPEEYCRCQSPMEAVTTGVCLNCSRPVNKNRAK